ncbi:MAG: MFS transporter [Dermatophilaceae bacterium]
MTSDNRASTWPPSGVETREQRAWYVYDWANSAYVTTVATVLIGPYLTTVATDAACPGLPSGEVCSTPLSVLGLAVVPGSLVPFTVTFTTIASAIILILVGGMADRSSRPSRLLAGFAWTGAVAACALFLVSGTNWQLGVLLLFVANICLGSSLVIYDSLLIRIAGPDDRDRVSSRGWAFGYLGGGLLLAINFALVLMHDRFGMDSRTATRVSLLSAGLWWGLFTIIPVLGLRRVSGAADTAIAPGKGLVTGSLRQLASTFRELGRYPQTQLFLLAYLFYNDGIQTVIYSSSIYGARELQFPDSTVLGLFLFVQFVAFAGALLFGKVAARIGAWRTVLSSLGIWTAIVVVAFFVPPKALVAFFGLGLAIGLVLGGSQALSRSLYSQLIPMGREAEFFGFYQAMERGTSWFGTLIFGVVYQVTLSYRWAIVALIVFFVLGGVLLSRVRMREGILAAGNELPAVV